MSVVDDAKKVLTLSDLHLPDRPKIARIEVDPYIDSDGQDALSVLLVLDERTQDADLKGTAIWAIQKAIIDRMTQQGISLYPYFRLAKQSELDALADESDDEDL